METLRCRSAPVISAANQIRQIAPRCTQRLGSRLAETTAQTAVQSPRCIRFRSKANRYTTRTNAFSVPWTKPASATFAFTTCDIPLPVCASTTAPSCSKCKNCSVTNRSKRPPAKPIWPTTPCVACPIPCRNPSLKRWPDESQGNERTHRHHRRNTISLSLIRLRLIFLPAIHRNWG